MANARSVRGRRTQKIIADYLRTVGWPRAKAVWGSMPGRDILNVPGHAIEVKARTGFNPKAWIEQAESNANGDRPCVVIRLNGQGEQSVGEYLVIRRLKDDELSRRKR